MTTESECCEVSERIRAAMAAGTPGPTLADLLHHDIEGNPLNEGCPAQPEG